VLAGDCLKHSIIACRNQDAGIKFTDLSMSVFFVRNLFADFQYFIRGKLFSKSKTQEVLFILIGSPSVSPTSRYKERQIRSKDASA